MVRNTELIHTGIIQNAGIRLNGTSGSGRCGKRTGAIFAKELAALQQAVDWEKHGAIYQSRTWADRYDRAIWVRLSAWHFGAEKAVVS